jgi:hypothetical protein
VFCILLQLRHTFVPNQTFRIFILNINTTSPISSFVSKRFCYNFSILYVSSIEKLIPCNTILLSRKQGTSRNNNISGLRCTATVDYFGPPFVPILLPPSPSSEIFRVYTRKLTDFPCSLAGIHDLSSRKRKNFQSRKCRRCLIGMKVANDGAHRRIGDRGA